MVCSMFLRSGLSVVRSASIGKGGTSKKRLSPHLHKVPTWSNKVSPQTFQMFLVYLKRDLVDDIQFLSFVTAYNFAHNTNILADCVY
jgi:hypothetical protein